MPSSSGKSGRAKAAREQPNRSNKTSASSSNAETTGGEQPTAQHGKPDDGSGAGNRRGGTPRGKNQRKAQRTGNQRTGNQPTAARAQGSTRRGSRRRGGAAKADAGQNRRRARRMRTVDETSAGGLVVDTATGMAALIGRLDRRGRLLWSLPKGHIESGETAEQAAIREVAEETGIDSAIMATLGSIDYWFVADDRRVHKTVHHFLLRALGGELSDADVEVTEVAWVPLLDLQERLAYADERRLVRRAADLLAESA
jgi:8-oxo-dGTP pyrophosphatase MutT (NUDIX family)